MVHAVTISFGSSKDVSKIPRFGIEGGRDRSGQEDATEMSLGGISDGR
jgi:hypothetical protein